MLEKFGLTKTEEKVYLALLRIGGSPAADLIKRTQLHRTTVYDVLDRLIEKGLVGYVVQNKIKHYSAAKPSKFLGMAKAEAQLAQEKQKLAREVASKLNQLEKDARERTTAQIFVGAKGVRTIMNDIIETRKNFISFGAAGRFMSLVPTHYVLQWAERRRKNNILAKIITIKGMKTTFKLNKVRYLPDKYFSPVSTLIYGDKVALIIRDEPIVIVLIESKKLAQSYKNYFELLWKIAK